MKEKGVMSSRPALSWSCYQRIGELCNIRWITHAGWNKKQPLMKRKDLPVRYGNLHDLFETHLKSVLHIITIVCKTFICFIILHRLLFINYYYYCYYIYIIYIYMYIYIGYESADLNVHPPPNCRGWVHFFRIGVQCSQKNVLKGKPVLFGVIQVKSHKNVFFQHIHSNQILVNLTILDYNE